MIVVVFEQATTPGSLDGYAIICDACGGKVGKNSFRSLAREMAADHELWHEGK